ncbi:MAG: tetratricopeptide repeat protein [Acidobacteria bacterium]|nr:tetratricopeptide repeat protein [Acidobacteriota bacterium]
MMKFRITVFLVALVLLPAFVRADDVPSSIPLTRDPHRLLAFGRADDAIGLLQQRISMNSRDAQAWNLLSRAFLTEEQWDKAVGAGEKAVEFAPDAAEYHLWLGRAYGERADHSNFIAAIRAAKRARSELERATSLQPNNVESQSDLAEFVLQAPGFLGGGLDKAERLQVTIAGLDPPSGHYWQARILEKKDRLDQAEREFHAAIDLEAHKAQYWMALAEFFHRHHRYDDMESALQQAVATGNRSDGVLMEAAALLLQANRKLETALKWLREYLNAPAPIESEPRFQAHYMLGTILEKQGNRNSAAAEYRSALQLASAFNPAQEALKRLGQ